MCYHLLTPYVVECEKIMSHFENNVLWPYQQPGNELLRRELYKDTVFPWRVASLRWASRITKATKSGLSGTRMSTMADSDNNLRRSFTLIFPSRLMHLQSPFLTEQASRTGDVLRTGDTYVVKPKNKPAIRTIDPATSLITSLPFATLVYWFTCAVVSVFAFGQPTIFGYQVEQPVLFLLFRQSLLTLSYILDSIRNMQLRRRQEIYLNRGSIPTPSKLRSKRPQFSRLILFYVHQLLT